MTASQSGPGLPDALTLSAFSGVVLLGGANAIAVKQTVMDLAPLWGASIRFSAAGALLLLVVAVTKRPLPKGKSRNGAALYGLLAIAIAYGLAYPAFRTVPAGTVMVLLALTPLFTLGLAVAHRQERFRIRGLIGGAISVGGVGVVFYDQLGSDVPMGPMMLVILAAVAVAESSVVLKGVPRSDPLSTNAVAMLTGAVLLLITSVATGETQTFPQDPVTWAAVAYLVVLGSVTMFVLYLFTLQRWTASGVSYTTLLAPLVTVALAVVFQGEDISVSFILGSLVIMVGVYVGAFSANRPRTSAISLPECLPIDACAAPIPVSSR